MCSSGGSDESHRRTHLIESSAAGDEDQHDRCRLPAGAVRQGARPRGLSGRVLARGGCPAGCLPAGAVPQRAVPQGGPTGQFRRGRSCRNIVPGKQQAGYSPACLIITFSFSCRNSFSYRTDSWDWSFPYWTSSVPSSVYAAPLPCRCCPPPKSVSDL